MEAACTGVAKTVADAQTDTGVKDAYTQYWIDAMIEKARILQQNKPQSSVGEIQAELVQWCRDHQDVIYNSFLTLDGIDLILRLS